MLLKYKIPVKTFQTTLFLLLKPHRTTKKNQHSAELLTKDLAIKHSYFTIFVLLTLH